ncbi:hypothetical protein [Desertivirga xinjiangensis]|uniref:hypothetical protein n=1 Tax=Desertivirga xinjiangensis TaxID=539206 RepID=UPI00210BB0EE|nr:hypothetical protein [Pedobacter xinjiangensis]
MIKKIKKLALLAMTACVIAACNKDELTQKAISIQIMGYNIGNSELEISIDTGVYDKFKTAPNTLLNFGKVYTYPSSKEQALLKIRDVVSGKEVYQNELDLRQNEFERFFPFVMINGTPLEIKIPSPDPATNKLAFYIYYPESSDLIDVFMRNETGQTVYIARNVMPATWAYADYVSAEGFKDPNKNYTWYFVKAGTTDQWAFHDDEYKSQSPTGTLYIPKNGETGRVQAYFVTAASNQLDVVSLFKP